MRTTFLTVMAFLSLSAVVAQAEVNLGGGVSFEAGGSPITPVMPQVYVQNVYRDGDWRSFCIDGFMAVSPFQNDSFAKGLPAGPEVVLGADVSYLFPRVGPAEFALLVGVSGFKDYHKVAEGVASQAGLDATLHLGRYFISGRGLYRFFASTGLGGAPVPLGNFGFMILGGYTFQ